jgi:hypothetical protein
VKQWVGNEWVGLFWWSRVERRTYSAHNGEVEEAWGPGVVRLDEGEGVSRYFFFFIWRFPERSLVSDQVWLVFEFGVARVS